MTEKKIANAVLEKITKEHIEPKSVWYFRIKNGAMWLGTVVFVIIGALALSVLLFMLYNGPWHLLGEADRGFMAYIKHMLSVAWLVLFIVLIVVAEIVLRRTKKGYKYPLIGIVGVLLGVSVAAAFAFHSLGIARNVDTVMSERAPFYLSMENRRDRLMYDPEGGILIGKVKKIESEACVLENKREGHEWIVQINAEAMDDFQNISAGDMIFVKGDMIDDFLFEAYQVNQLEKPRKKPQPQYSEMGPPPSERSLEEERITQ